MTYRCGTCRWYDPETGVQGEGMCRAALPKAEFVPTRDEDGNESVAISTVWPPVRPDIDWCREYKENPDIHMETHNP